MTREEINARLSAIEAEKNHLEEMQYKYGYIFDRQTRSKLYREKQELTKLLSTLTGGV